MREVLFRGYSTVHRKWFYGDLLHCSDGLRISNEESFVAVSKKTVGQYTGLTDKNGTKIFEGDIVKREFTLHHGETKKTRETQIGVVGFKRGEFMANVIKGRGTWFGIGIVWKGDYLEIIGNIHDNPELLKWDIDEIHLHERDKIYEKMMKNIIIRSENDRRTNN